jgi:hypothetical protein
LTAGATSSGRQATQNRGFLAAASIARAGRGSNWPATGQSTAGMPRANASLIEFRVD